MKKTKRKKILNNDVYRYVAFRMKRRQIEKTPKNVCDVNVKLTFELYIWVFLLDMVLLND